MGYYSTINAFDFQSKLTEEELKGTYKEFIEGLNENDRAYMEDFYGFAKVSEEDGLHEYDLEIDDYHAKHYADRSLAEFVSKVIAPGTHTVIEFCGEDGERWGYLVLPGEAHDVSFIGIVNGMRIHEFLASRERNDKNTQFQER